MISANASRALRQAVTNAEKETVRLTARRSEIERAMFDPASAGAQDRQLTMTELMKARADVERQLAAAEAHWLEASEALEQAG